MTLLKILFLLLIVVPFALFLLFIVDKLMDEMPSRSEMEAEMSAVERRRHRAAANKSRSRKGRSRNKPRSQGGTGRSKRRRSR